MFMNDAEVDKMRLGGEKGLTDLRDPVGFEEDARVWRNRIGGSNGRSFEMYAGSEYESTSTTLIDEWSAWPSLRRSYAEGLGGMHTSLDVM